jgi:hypothetical protein
MAMNIYEILSSVKGKVLDLKDIELLRSAYELQNQVNEQLKVLNSVTGENNKMLTEKVEQLQTEIKTLRSENKQLASQIPPPTPKEPYVPSGVALEVLQFFRDEDVTEMGEDLLDDGFIGRAIEVEAGMHELIFGGFLRNIGGGGKGWYILNTEGRNYVLGLKKKARRDGRRY